MTVSDDMCRAARVERAAHRYLHLVFREHPARVGDGAALLPGYIAMDQRRDADGNGSDARTGGCWPAPTVCTPRQASEA